jgi:hypothetical protein
VPGSTINSGGAENTMGGGLAILTFISIPAIVGIGSMNINVKSIIPKNNFFILLPPIQITVLSP